MRADNETELKSDQGILSKVSDNDREVWVLYNRYGSVMYGIICALTDSQTIAEEILVEVISRLKENQVLLKNTTSVLPCLMRHTHTFAKNWLLERKMPCVEIQKNASTLIGLFCFEHTSIKEVAMAQNVNEEDVKKSLHEEFVALRSKSRQKQKSFWITEPGTEQSTNN